LKAGLRLGEAGQVWRGRAEAETGVGLPTVEGLGKQGTRENRDLLGAVVGAAGEPERVGDVAHIAGVLSGVTTPPD
jgi:hypothetical protein